MEEAIAITGMGAVTAQGIGVEATWTGVCEGRDALSYWPGVPAEHPLHRLRVAACPTLFHPGDLPPRLWNVLSRTQQLACVAFDQAIAQAQLPHRVDEAIHHKPVGLFVATTVCGMDLNERFFESYRRSRELVDPSLMKRLQPYEVGALLQRRHHVGQSGVNSVCLTTCVGSAMQISTACDAIHLGECDVAIAGGAESLCRVVLSGFNALKVVAADGCRPFDKNRPGMTVGEGSGMIVLERLSHARARGVRILATIRGTGISCDAYHITAPMPSGQQAIRAMDDALTRAGLSRADVDYVNAHGTGTRENDATETRTLAAFFGVDGATIPVISSTKRSTGHTLGAAGALETILCVEALRRSTTPINAGSIIPDDVIELPIQRGSSGSKALRHAMSVNFAFGGNNTAIVLSKEAA